MAAKWYYRSGASLVGPISSSGLRRLIVGGKIGRQTYIREGPQGDWVLAGKVEGLFVPADAADAWTSPPKLPDRPGDASLSRSDVPEVEPIPEHGTHSTRKMTRSPWLGVVLFAGPVLIVLLVLAVKLNWPAETSDPAPVPGPAGVPEDPGRDQPEQPSAAVTFDRSGHAEEPPAEEARQPQEAQEPATSDSGQDEAPDASEPGEAADAQPESTADLSRENAAGRPSEAAVVEAPADASSGEPGRVVDRQPAVAPDADQEDERLAEFRRIHQEVVEMFDEWKEQRDTQNVLEQLLEPVAAECARLEKEEAFIKERTRFLQDALAAARGQGDLEEMERVSGMIRGRQVELAALQATLKVARTEKLDLEKRLAPVRKQRAALEQRADALGNEWLSLSDPFGKLSPAAHERAKDLLDEWIMEESELPLLYMARGFAHLHTGEYNLALDDFEETVGFERTQQIDARMGALVRAAAGYALNKKGDVRNGMAQFAQALKRDQGLAIIYVFRGHSYVVQEKYSQAAGDFKIAVQLAAGAPEAHEAYARLLATCPHQTVRNGRKAVEHATTACELTRWESWFCLDTLATAYAEAGQFDTALEYAGRALQLAPKESQLGLRQKMSLYQAGKPWRMK